MNSNRDAAGTLSERRMVLRKTHQGSLQGTKLLRPGSTGATLLTAPGHKTSLIWQPQGLTT